MTSTTRGYFSYSYVDPKVGRMVGRIRHSINYRTMSGYFVRKEWVTVYELECHTGGNNCDWIHRNRCEGYATR